MLRVQIHSIRDHPNHDRPLNGGMWGGVRGVVTDMAALVSQWSNRDRYNFKLKTGMAPALSLHGRKAALNKLNIDAARA